MVVFYYELECHAEKLNSCLQSHNKSICHQNMTVSALSSELLTLIQNTQEIKRMLFNKAKPQQSNILTLLLASLV